VTLKARGDADGRHVGELENPVVRKEIGASVNRGAEVSHAIEKFSEQFVCGRHGGFCSSF
jgi:hypothetical protein